MPRTHRHTDARALVAALAVALLLFGAVVPAAASSERVPAGWKRVTWRGISLQVPGSWPVYDLSKDPARCVLFNRHAVYLGEQSPGADCPAKAIGKVEAVQVQPGSWVDPSGRASSILGRTLILEPNAGVTHSDVAYFPSAGITVEATYLSSPTTAAKILASVAGSYVGPASAGPADNGYTSPPAPSSPNPVGVQSPVSETAGASVSPTAPTAASDFTGYGFDTCSAPSTGQMKAWLASPYRALGIYIGGVNRACPDGNLSQLWVQTVEAQGWNLAPLYVGLQAPCATQSGLAHIDSKRAAGEGKAAADDAVSRAQYFGLGKGTPIYLDMESYNNSIKTCSNAVLAFEQAWTIELHSLGYVSGIYGSLDSTIADLTSRYNDTKYTEPDDLWYAVWDNQASVADYPPNLPTGYWANHQRMHQYRGGHPEKYGGVSLNIDNDYVDCLLANSGVYSWSLQHQAAFTNATKKTAADLTAVDPGDTAWLVVTAHNTGSATWYRSGPAPVEIATWNPKYQKSRFATPAWIDATRPAALTQSSVPPGGTGTFAFPINIPPGGGSFDLKLNLVARGVTWFNDAGLDYGIFVHVPLYAGLNSAGAMYASKLGTTPYSSLGGSLVAPPAVVRGSDGTVYYIGEGTDHDVYVRTDTTGWAAMSPTGTWCAYPSAWISGTALTVACQGQYGGLRVGSTTLVPGLLPQVHTYQMMGGSLRGGASVAPIGGTLTYFSVQKPAPSGYDVYRRTASTGWFRLPYVCAGRPAVSSNGHLAYFACVGSDHRVWWMRNPGSGWTTMRSIGGSPRGQIAVTVAPDGGASVFVMTGTHSIAWNQLPAGSASTWHVTTAKAVNGVGAGEI
jgi:hypothetical protein